MHFVYLVNQGIKYLNLLDDIKFKRGGDLGFIGLADEGYDKGVKILLFGFIGLDHVVVDIRLVKNKGGSIGKEEREG